MIIIGIDPDSKAHGVAIYKNKKLIELKNLQLMDIVNKYIISEEECFFAVENVVANKPIFSDKTQKSKRAQGRVGQNVGQCKQSQIELVRALDYYNASYVMINPQPGNWGKCKTPKITQAMTNQFKKVTGWSGRSNSDTRSAAFFGYIAMNRFK